MLKVTFLKLSGSFCIEMSNQTTSKKHHLSLPACLPACLACWAESCFRNKEQHFDAAAIFVVVVDDDDDDGKDDGDDDDGDAASRPTSPPARHSQLGCSRNSRRIKKCSKLFTILLLLLLFSPQLYLTSFLHGWWLFYVRSQSWHDGVGINLNHPRAVT